MAESRGRALWQFFPPLLGGQKRCRRRPSPSNFSTFESAITHRCRGFAESWCFQNPAAVAGIEFAIFLNQGAPYFTGTEVPFVAPSVIRCIQLGATVDYAILLTSRFQEELRRGRDRHEAALIAGASSDASIITSALVLFCATLGVAFVSSIDLIGAICVMLARGAIISALVSIFVIPALLCVCEPVFHKTSLYWRTEKPGKASVKSA